MKGEIAKIDVKKAALLLAQQGIMLNEDEIKKLIDFLYRMADIAVEQYLRRT